MLIGCFGDCHITKNMKTLQNKWEESVKKSIHHMYNYFDEEGVESVVCLGDFFDAPRIEARHINLVLPILDEINSKTYPTYILLGNHEIDSEDSNILDYLTTYENIIPVTTPKAYENLFFIPYGVDPSLLSFRDEDIVFTHHDIYGSELASGKTKAFFGINPDIFKTARMVLNGHVHLKSRVTHNIINAGSILSSQYGELKLGDYPSYYLIDTNTSDIKELPNVYSLIYLTIDEKDITKVKEFGYDTNNVILKVEYENTVSEDCLKEFPHYTWRKKISSIGENNRSYLTTTFDLNNYLIDYIKRDEDVSQEKKESYISTGLELLK